MNIKKLLLGFVLTSIIAINVNYSITYANEPNNKKVGFYKTADLKDDFNIKNGVLMKNGNVFIYGEDSFQIYNTKNEKFEKVSTEGYTKIKEYGSEILALNDGRVLIMGEDDSWDHPLIQYYMLQVYNPKTKSFKKLLSGEVYDRFNISSCIQLNNGNVFIATRNNFYIYDIKLNKLSKIDIEKFGLEARSYEGKESLELIENDNILIFGSSIINQKTNKGNLVYEYKSDSNSIYPIEENIKSRNGNVFTHKIDNENIIVFGGDLISKNSNPIYTIEKYNIKNQKTEIIGTIPFSTKGYTKAVF